LTVHLRQHPGSWHRA